jgi:hypothetical protein
MESKAGVVAVNNGSADDVEIRAVPGKPDGWEVLSSARCCVFEWGRACGRGTVFIDGYHAHEHCREEVREYARRRGYQIEAR